MDTPELPLTVLAREGCESHFAGDVTPEALRALFAAAARLWDADLWDIVPDKSIQRVTIEDFDIFDGAFSMDRDGEGAPGLTLIAKFEVDCDHAHGDHEHAHEQFEVTRLRYAPRGDFEPSELEELQAIGLPADQVDRVPMLFALDSEMDDVAPNVQEVSQMETLALALCEWFSNPVHGDVRAMIRGRKEVRARVAVKAREGTYQVEFFVSPAAAKATDNK
jgi:hypothetical protein